MPDFEFDEGTDLTPKKPGRPRARRLNVEKPDAKPQAKATEPKDGPIRRPGAPRTGRWPIRQKTKKPQRSHEWGASREWEPIFVAALGRFGIIREACIAAQVNRCTVLRRQKQYPEFAEACETAKKEFRDGVVAHAWDLALNGVPQFALDRKTGDAVWVGNKPDPLLLMFMMKQLDPTFKEKYLADDNAGAAEGFVNLVAKFMQNFDPTSDQQAQQPSFDEFSKQASLPAPVIDTTAELAADRIRRLEAELAALRATQAPAPPTPAADGATPDA